MVAKIKKINIWLVLIGVIILSATAVFFPLAIAFGWFTSTNNNEKETDIKPFKVEIQVWFDKNTNHSYDIGTDILQNSTTAFSIDLTNSASDNYYKKLHVNATYIGNEDAVMRVHVIHLWRQGDTNIPSRANIKYDYNTTSIIDSSKSNNCYYYCNIAGYNAVGATPEQKAEAYVLKPANSGKAFSVITGSSQTTIYESTLTLQLLIKAELTQPNRTQQLWGALPVPPTT